ncbi:hypothetical protein BCR41DRAFT_358683 [Lobosporangium transversale]|uniref:F-box domain-containing protein n=1 Tax=Lobosporangium transversale TaxID=64571 RepID=A0A1Y2GFM9_9FUNG|nr:hypothetical protein BCR41DRAFT_358683 [Lobosporangium transversale]ORZ09423.1 hypothetical protein BCR41DRAFT_358683 [Lobosporangium transversale]|eukprot:XP_021878876.1 hypothetical protein BCR41DRAFT_358683 [Lobosporangium transversale]
MNNLNSNPLDIPEIVSLVGRFLDYDDCLRCIRVSKTFHNTLAKAIWRDICVDADSTYPSGEALYNYKKYIEDLTFFYYFPEDYLSLQGCDRLQSIRCEVQRKSDLRQISDLIDSHSSTITYLTFTCPSLGDIWEPLLKCTRLEVLSVSKTRIFENEIDQFFQVFKQIKYLNMTDASISQLPSDFLGDEADKYIFPNMSTLYLHNVRIHNPPRPYTSSYCLGILTRRCPKLQSLYLYDYKKGSLTMDQLHLDFCRTAFLHHTYTVANLSDLSLASMKIKDEDMAAILRRMTQLRRLKVPWGKFGQLSMRELLADEHEALEDGNIVQKRRGRRLCDMVEELEWSEQSERTDGVIQAILSNCPRLKKLKGSTMTVTEVANGAEWVSTGLTEMQVNLVVDVDQTTEEGKEKGRIVYDRIHSLARLYGCYCSRYNRLLSFAGMTPENSQS